MENKPLNKNKLDGKQVWRYERKIPIINYDKKQLEFLIRRNFYSFVPHYPDRYIYNIYYDSNNFQYFHENQEGLSNRKKIRLRWYNNNQKIHNSKLEIKSKKGMVGSKQVFHLPDFNMLISSKNLVNTNRKLLEADSLPNWVKEMSMFLQPTLFNSYKRQYYISKDKLFRITLDTQLTFQDPLEKYNVSKLLLPSNLMVLEIKYLAENDQKASEIMNSFPFRVDKFSKYVFGLNKIRIKNYATI
ncbi:hypothetical protein DID75_00315 [Candidatus Marinamargulisbacteria bacterium SCGC AG-410-N11]|nr:hypothetical protein DID75_00315 [Candidatus Marinamargulisbacteria bacterium SCGC AG-410-N11]